MSGHHEDQGPCEAISEDLTELALGTLSGRRRSEVLDHVESCQRCRAELEQLARVADHVLELAPEAEPPLGFELRLAQRLQAQTGASRPRRVRRAGLLAVAAALLVVLGLSIGTLISAPASTDHPRTTTATLASANLSSGGQVLGKVFVSTGSPAWMLMTIDNDTWSGIVTCQVILADGSIETIGRFKLSGTYAAWGAALSAPVGQVRSARLVSAAGTVLASARFPA